MLEKLTIAGFKSIKELSEFELKSINVLIGANGAGKSNFIDFFKMLRSMLGFDIAELQEPSLAAFITNEGEMDNLVFNGSKITDHIHTSLIFNEGLNGYRFDITPTGAAGFLINNEACYYKNGDYQWWELGSGHTTPKLIDYYKIEQKRKQAARYSYIFETIKSWQIYHFHDTSQFAKVRQPNKLYDNQSLQFDASNIAAFLYALKQQRNGGSEAYEDIVETIKIIAPFFEDFLLEPYVAGQEEKIKLQWKQKGSNLPMQAYHLSDGTLRFICLVTALLQPKTPELMLIDEPELGLHPEALELLAEIIKLRREKTQFILSTQSPSFADFFAPEDIVTIKRNEGATSFERLEPEKLSGWLDKYSIGQLWRKNVIKGGTVNE